MQTTTEIESKIEDFTQIFQIYDKICQIIFRYPIFTNSKDLVFIFRLGGLVNDIIYKQQSIFHTRGLIKKIPVVLHTLSYYQITELYNLCDRIQNVLKNKTWKNNYKNEFLTSVGALKEKLNISDWTSSHSLLSIVFLAGYNFYNVAWKMMKSKIKVDDISEKNIFPDLDFYYSHYPDLKKNLDLPKYKENNSFNTGLLFGLYYFDMASLQKSKLNTASLLKFGSQFFKHINEEKTLTIIANLNEINVKISSITQKNDNDSDVFYLYHPAIILNLFYLFFSKDISWTIDENYFRIGCGFAKSLIEQAIFSKNNAIPDNSLLNDITEQDRKFISEKEIIESLEKNEFKSNYEKLCFISGIFLNVIAHDEEEILKLKRLKKSFSYLIRHFKHESILSLISEFVYSTISCWIFQTTNGKYYTRYPKLNSLLVSELGSINNKEVQEAEAVLNLINGYHLIRTLFWNTKNKK